MDIGPNEWLIKEVDCDLLNNDMDDLEDHDAWNTVEDNKQGCLLRDNITFCMWIDYQKTLS